MITLPKQWRATADAWAKANGFENAAKLPADQLGALAQHVSKTESVSLEKVQTALFATLFQTKPAVHSTVEPSGKHVAIPQKGVFGDAAAEPKGLTPVTPLQVKFESAIEEFQATRVVVTRQASPEAVRDLFEASAKLIARFDELDGVRDTRQITEEITKSYKDLLSLAARHKGIMLTQSTPQLDAIAEDLAKNGAAGPAADVDRRPGLGTGASLAVDPNTKQVVAYDYLGSVESVASINDFVARYQEAFQADKDVAKLEAQPKTLAQLRSVDDAQLARLKSPVEHVSLLDDTTGFARVFPTRWHKGGGELVSQRLIVDGPFKGIYLDDLANHLLSKAGAGYRYDLTTGKGARERAHTGEPFVTSTRVEERGEKREKLLVRIPEDRGWTEVRRQLRRLSELQPSIKYRQDTKNTTFSFGYDDYKLVRDVIGGGLLSEGAAQKLDAHFEKLTEIERASSDAALVNHTAKAIGGFRAEVKTPAGQVKPLELSYWQQKSLAWLEARGYKGVIGLGTGMGKTLVAIGAMQELKTRQKVTKPFLLVTPPALAGNFAKEIYKFLEPKEAEALVKQTVVLDYQTFSRAVRDGKLDGKPFKPEQFGAVIFDEAQTAKNRKSVAGAAALAFKHEHKIVLGASVMKNSIDDIFTLTSIANNVDLNDRVEGKELRHEMRKFVNLHTQTVGGRTVAVREAIELTPGEKLDPKHNLYTFVRANVLYADKRNDTTKLPRLTMRTETLRMTPTLEAEYRKKIAGVTKLMRGMVSLYRDQGVKREYIDEKGRTRREIEPLARNEKISKMFGPELRAKIADINSVTNNEKKLDRAADLVFSQLELNPKTRTVLFTDSAEYVVQSAQRMSEKIPGKIHAAALGKEIRLFQNGKELKELDGHTLPFKEQEYKTSERTYAAKDWQQYVLSEVLGQNTDVATTTLFGPVYQEGQNMQWAQVGIHLDRDTWSRQNMEQREGRIWRQGQPKPVTFYNLDWVYKEPNDKLDRSLDEVRGIYESSEGKLFHDVIVVPQATELGSEWPEVRDLGALKLDTAILDAMLQPTAANAAERGEA